MNGHIHRRVHKTKINIPRIASLYSLLSPLEISSPRYIFISIMRNQRPKCWQEKCSHCVMRNNVKVAADTNTNTDTDATSNIQTHSEAICVNRSPLQCSRYGIYLYIFVLTYFIFFFFLTLQPLFGFSFL